MRFHFITSITNFKNLPFLLIKILSKYEVIEKDIYG